MDLALAEARAALEHDDVPIGAVVVRLDTGDVVARRHNERELRHDPTAHAELLAIRDAATVLGRWRLNDCALVVTLEPCPMCAGAAVAARLGLVAFGAPDPNAGAFGSLYHLGADPRLNHEVRVVDGIRAAESAALLQEFFAARRNRASP
ncbi:MAG: nucleoside deaminase [Actinobacteria bacterium]|nr:MAG: nucleoside deaminase [Actinomycetota bacterium]